MHKDFVDNVNMFKRLKCFILKSLKMSTGINQSNILKWE